MRNLALGTAMLVLTAATGAAAERAIEDVKQRVDHHLTEADRLARHFEGVMAGACPRFASPSEWDAHLDGVLDRVVLLLAHVERAWIEAKQTGDDGVRRVAKGPRRQKEQARALVDKLSSCAADNGASFSHLALWQRIERELPERQAAIALPQ